MLKAAASIMSSITRQIMGERAFAFIDTRGCEWVVMVFDA